MTEQNPKPIRETKGLLNKICIIPGRLDGKLAIVTGANTGIGFYTASELARRGCQVIMACRSRERAEAARMSILDKYGSANPRCLDVDVGDEQVKSSLSAVKPEQLIIEDLDLASLTNIRSFVKRFTSTHSRLDFLINNAGMVASNFSLTEDNLETMLATNHLGPFLLTELLLPLLKQSGPARVIMVSSFVHAWGSLNRPDLQTSRENYRPFWAYVQSKLANVVYARELSHRLEDSSVTVVSLHPGTARTELTRNASNGHQKRLVSIMKPFWISPWAGCQTTMYTILCPNLVSGGYYRNCTLKQPGANAVDEDTQNWLREKSSELVGLNGE